MKKISLFLLLVFYTNMFCYAQDLVCNTDEIYSDSIDPFLKSGGNGCAQLPVCNSLACEDIYEFVDDNELLTIKVVFHLIHNPATTTDPTNNVYLSYNDSQTTYETIQTHIGRVNQIYAGTFDDNYDTDDMTEADTKIQFVLPTTDPCGTELEFAGLQEHFPTQAYYDEIKSDYNISIAHGQYRWPNNYINVFLIEDGQKGANSSLSNPVSIPDVPFSDEDNFIVAETLAHEIGHSLGLKHTFKSPCDEFGTDDGTPSDDCKIKGDYVCDTQSHSDNYGEDLCYNNDYINELETIYPFYPVRNNIMCYKTSTSSTIREGFTVGQKQRMRYYIKNHLFSLINETNYTEIEVDTEWTDQKKYVDGYILVKTGSKLTISNSVILFSPYSKIYVEPGGALEINNCSYLSSIYDSNFYGSTNNIWNNYHANNDWVNEFFFNCASFPSQYDYDILWDGIVALGIGEEPEDFSIDNVSDNMGIVKIDDSTIAFANQGVATFDPLFGYNENNFGQGMETGVVQIQNSDFINNLNSVNIMGNRDYNYSNIVTNSYFDNTAEFVSFYLSDNDDNPWDGQGNGGGAFYDLNYLFSPIPEGFLGANQDFIAYGTALGKFHLDIVRSNNFEVHGNLFKSGAPYKPFGGGIRARNSAINIGKSDATLEEKNEFIKLNIGIDVYGLNDIASPVNVYGSYFEDISRGITLNTNPFSQIAQNEFSRTSGVADSYEYWIYLNESFACEIFDNDISSNAGDNQIYGICINNSFNSDLYETGLQSTIYGNTFRGDLNACVDVRGSNTDLQLGCNAFNKINSKKPYDFFYFADAEDGTLFELDEQGKCDEQSTLFHADEMDLTGDLTVNRVYVEGNSNEVIFNHGPTTFPTNSNGDGSINSFQCSGVLEDNQCTNLPAPDGFINGNEGPDDVIDITDIISVINIGDLTSISNEDLGTIRRLLEENNEVWAQKLLINNLVAYKDSLEAEEQLATFPEDTQDNIEYKTLLTAINRGGASLTGKKSYTDVSTIAEDKGGKYASMAESALATVWGQSYQRNAPNRNKSKQIIEESILKEIECYPNPANKQITIYWEGFNPNKFNSNIRVLDLTGQIATKISAQECLINQNGINFTVENLENGVYIVQIEGMAASTKLIINR